MRIADGAAKRGDVLRSVRGGDGDAQAGGAAGDARVTNRRDENAALAQAGGQIHGLALLADVEREDRALHRRQGAAGADEFVLEFIDPLPEARAERFTFGRLNQSNGSRRSRGGRGDWGRAEDEAAGPVDEQFDELARAGDESARGAQGLAQSAHLNLDVAGQPLRLGESAAVLSEKAGGVRFIEQKPGAVLLLELDDFAQRGEIAVHAEHAFGDDEKARGAWCVVRACSARAGPFQNLFQ